MLQDDTGSPELPELPLYVHAAFKDPGGVASTRRYALETAALQDYQTRQLSYPSALIYHNSTIFQGSIYSLHTRYTLAPHASLPWPHLGFATNLLAKL
jgi:hypothetical protein|tara:strand:- start:104 stop:397 length:294 start_codon:yes stop_codon:yes gene_type:complete